MHALTSDRSSGPLVTIIITNYNYADYIGQAIESALHQTYPNLEVMVIDDGSTDGSQNIISSYPILIFEQENHGLCATRNRGANLANGDYLVFLDADDTLEATYVARCLEVLAKETSDVAYVYTQMHIFGDCDYLFLSKPFDARELMRHGNFIHASSLIRKSSFLECGGYDIDWLDPFEDYLLYVKLLSKGYQGRLVPEPLLNYRKHGVSRNSMTPCDAEKICWKIRSRYYRLYYRYALPRQKIELMLRKCFCGPLLDFLKMVIRRIKDRPTRDLFGQN